MEHRFLEQASTIRASPLTFRQGDEGRPHRRFSQSEALGLSLVVHDIASLMFWFCPFSRTFGGQQSSTFQGHMQWYAHVVESSLLVQVALGPFNCPNDQWANCVQCCGASLSLAWDA